MARYAALLLVVVAGCNGDRAASKPKQDGTVNSGAPGAGLVPAKDGDVAAAKESDAPAGPETIADWPKPLVALVITGQQLGYIEPCGCSGLENQKGGLARRQTFIKQLADEKGWTVVPLDVGSQVKGFGKQQEIKFAETVQGLRAMGYRAVTLGDADLRLTPGEVFAVLADPASGKINDFISANVSLFDRDAQPRWLVIEAGGKKIGVTAVLGEKYEARLRGDEIVHQPPLEALKKSAADLQSKQCDFFVLLAHAPMDEARKLAAAVPGFDLVVASGETPVASHELETVAGTKTRLMQVGQKAMYAGVVGLFDNPKTPIRYDSVALDARFADSPAMLKLLADYQEQLKELGLEGLGIKPQPHPSGRKFVGSQKCGECHTKAMEKWRQTPHSHATDSLVTPPNTRASIPRHYDPECLSCHVTGWEPQHFIPYDSGYQSLEKTPQLVGSGCENCHGPGSAHAAAESGDMNVSAAELGKLRESMRLSLASGAAEKCMECHDFDNSPDFHKPGAFDRYWQKVEHSGKD